MSVVAGCSLFDGVLITSDCRATFQMRDQPDIYSDTVLKVMAVLPHTAIGFVGDIEAASYLLKCLLLELRKQDRTDPISLANWIPRLFRHKYGRFAHQYGKRPIHFMIGSVLVDRQNIVKREAVFELIRTIGFGESQVTRNWIPSLLFNLANTSKSGDEWIEIPGTCRNILYTLNSPSFEQRHVLTLQFAAMGSGESCVEEIRRYHDTIFAFQPGNAGLEDMWLRESIRHFIQERKIQSVGGLYPVIKVTGREEPQHIGLSTEIPVGGTKIELMFNPRSYQWKQRNLTSGKEMPIIMPWDFLRNIRQQIRNRTFDDFDLAYSDFRGKTQ